MSKPWLLDIGCCQGAATRGYQLAGWRVTGVDTKLQPRYIGDNFLQADGLEVLADSKFLRQFQAVHTSWPCQGYTECQRIQGNDHPMLIEPGRELLIASGLPYIQENVESAPTREAMKDPVMLCGVMFPGLNTHRHRLFESNVPLMVPEHPAHVQRTVKMGRPLREGDWYHAVGNFSNVPYVRANMGVPWMSRDGIRECIPPVYTELLGRQLLQQIS